MAQTCFALHRSKVAQAFASARFAVRAVRATLAAVVLLAAAAGCAYRMDIQQGNVIEEDALQQLQEGMTRSQVRFLLGTPLIADPFHADRWDYAYYYRRGRQREVERRWISVHFEDDQVTRIEERIAPEGETASEVTPDTASQG